MISIFYWSFVTGVFFSLLGLVLSVLVLILQRTSKVNFWEYL